MGKSERFVIQLEGFPDDVDGSYVTGDHVKGKVLVELKKDTDVYEVYIVFKAKCLTRWYEYVGAGYTSVGGVRTYGGRENYLNEKIPLYTRTGKLPAGCHMFPFSFQLPKNVPSSYFMGHNMEGRVTYKLEAVLQKFSNSMIMRRIWVTSPFDLKEYDYNASEDRKLQGGKEVSGEDAISELCCKSRIFTWKFQVANKTGYIPGETIKVHVFMRNTTNTIFTPRIKFTQLVQLLSDHLDRKKNKKNILYDHAKSSVNPGEQIQYDVNIEIPKDIVQSELRYCKLITIRYYVALHIGRSGGSPLREIKIPIIIGTEMFDCNDSSFTKLTLESLRERIVTDMMGVHLNAIDSNLMINIENRM